MYPHVHIFQFMTSSLRNIQSKIGKLRNNDYVMIQIITYRSRNENNGFNRRSPSTAEGQHSTWQYITPLNSK